MTTPVPYANSKPLTILWLSGYYYQEALRSMGHRVISIVSPPQKARSEDDIEINFFENVETIADRIRDVVDKYSPDVIIQADDAAPLIHLGLESVPVPKIFLSGSARYLLWQKYYATLFDHVFCAHSSDQALLSLKKERCSWLVTGLVSPTSEISYHEKEFTTAYIGKATEAENPIAYGVLEILKAHGVVMDFVTSNYHDSYRARYGITISETELLTASFFAIPARGSLLFMNRVPDAHEILTPGEDYIEFVNATDLVKKIEWANKNPDAVAQMIAKAQQKILSHYSITNSCESIIAKAHEIIALGRHPCSDSDRAYLGYAYQLCSQYQLPEVIIDFFTAEALEITEDVKYDETARPWALLTQGILAYDNEEPLRAYRTLSNILKLPADVEFQIQYYKYIVMSAIQCEYLPKVVQYLRSALEVYPDYPEFLQLKESVRLEDLEKKLETTEETLSTKGDDDEQSPSVDATRRL